ncbi:Thioredoxin domain-containing protein 3-like protein [Acropora cervicornis]|uniref:Thioredoxin domain-containing protein 3-like protein n=1 Tax=Acropora cervicornis TaxID=6130 RepID=A0AAD9QFV2_ACRCE|nr:Thioredoxin domain-containing protein 3-like protein [Acropora cervicornis]
MAKSKGKVDLQVEIKTQEQWDELLTKEGLIVVDTYATWCGPCKAIVSSFKRLKNELGDDLLGGILINVVRGCNCPLLIKTIRSELEKEHKVINGTSQRVAFVDQEALKEPVMDEQKDERMEEEEEEEELVELPKQVEDAGMEVLKKEEKVLGPCMTLLLSKAGDAPDAADSAIDYFRDLIGPKDVNIAKEEAPASLRALYGTDTVMNAVHGCDSAESAARELAFFYPDFVAPTIVQRRKKKQMTLSREQAEEFYTEHKDAEFFETLVTNMTSGPMMALCLAREDAVEGWRELLGPKDISEAVDQAPESLRQQFHVEESPVNPLHGSDSTVAAEKEIQQLFPVQSTLAVIKPEMEPDKRDDVIQRIKEAGFKIQFEKEVTLTKELASQFYHEHEGKDFFDGLTDHMASGPTLFMVLTREDAVTGWRAMMGPTDPQQALEVAPNSLRAQFGTDTMKNAVHGSSTVEKAEKVIKEFLPEVEILPDGTVRVPKDEAPAPDKHKNEQEDTQRISDQFSEPLGMEDGSIPDDAIKASSELDDQHSASRARLNAKPAEEKMGAWVPLESDENQWLQVDLGKVTRLTKIALQGEAGESSRHIKEFSVSCSLDGEGFLLYREDNADKVFEGSTDQETVVTASLKNPVITQYVKLHPKTWNEGIAMRTEFYGSSADTYSQPLGMENGNIPDDAIKASTELDDQHSASRARLNAKPDGEKMGAWVPLESDENQWLQVDLGKVAEITKVSTQGGGEESEQRVVSFVLAFSEDQENFLDYQENGDVKVFEGNTDGNTTVSHWLVQPVRARFCTVKPKTWNEQIALRLELYGKVALDGTPVADELPEENEAVQPQDTQHGEESAENQEVPAQESTEAVPEAEETAEVPNEVKESPSEEGKADEGDEEVAKEEAVDENGTDQGKSIEDGNAEGEPEEGQVADEVKEGVDDSAKEGEGQDTEEVKGENADEGSKPTEPQKGEQNADEEGAEKSEETAETAEEVKAAGGDQADNN